MGRAFLKLFPDLSKKQSRKKDTGSSPVPPSNYGLIHYTRPTKRSDCEVEGILVKQNRDRASDFLPIPRRKTQRCDFPYTKYINYQHGLTPSETDVSHKGKRSDAASPDFFIGLLFFDYAVERHRSATNSVGR